MIERKVKSVRALERGLDVLLEIHRCRAASLKELHHSTGLPKATLLRMLLTLSKRGLVWQRLADGAFLPSRMHKVVDWHAESNETLAELASPHLAELHIGVGKFLKLKQLSERLKYFIETGGLRK